MRGFFVSQAGNEWFPLWFISLCFIYECNSRPAGGTITIQNFFFFFKRKHNWAVFLLPSMFHGQSVMASSSSRGRAEGRAGLSSSSEHGSLKIIKVLCVLHGPKRTIGDIYCRTTIENRDRYLATNRRNMTNSNPTSAFQNNLKNRVQISHSFSSASR